MVVVVVGFFCVVFQVPFGSVFFFFFQAEDGIRDDLVTGVQTCALPICNKLVEDYQALTDNEWRANDIRSFRFNIEDPNVRDRKSVV